MEISEIRMKEALLFSFGCVGGEEQTHDVLYPKFELLSEWKLHDNRWPSAESVVAAAYE
jgi:hypothetical protein